MGCVSSKLLKKTLKQELLVGNGDLPNHVVSLTSTTYGALKLDQDSSFSQTPPQITPPCISKAIEKEINAVEERHLVGSKRSPPKVEPTEVINTWELMSDLEDEMKSPKLMMGGKDESLSRRRRSPFKSLVVHQLSSPKGGNKLGGKENISGLVNNNNNQSNYITPKGVLKSWKFVSNSNSRLRKAASLESPRRSTSCSAVSSSRRKSLSPLFDPELIDSLDKELCLEEEEQIKTMVSPKKPNNSKTSRPSSVAALVKYEEKCPPGGEHCVVIYTTTLRGIRKTFEDCNVVRSAIESYHIRVIERDISMDSGFKEELRKLMGTKEVKVPLVFVKGRLIGGADEVVKLDEGGKLEGLLEGIPKAVFGCEGCGGIRFVMCMECNGSCKVLDQDQRSMVRCGECNENGLLQCPLCC